MKPKLKAKPASEDAFFKAVEEALFEGEVDPVTEEGLIEAVQTDAVLCRRMRALLVGDRNMRRQLPRMWDKLVEMTPPTQLTLR